jgi:hypothetical protein
MATLLYKDFLIIATVEAKANGWRSIVDINGPDPDSRVINDCSKSFQTEEEAETFGVDSAKAWVDERCKTLIH